MLLSFLSQVAARTHKCRKKKTKPKHEKKKEIKKNQQK